MVFVDGISFIPNNGSQTQKIPPITSVRDNKVNSAAGIALEPMEYKIRPRHTSMPCKENIELLQLVEKKVCLVIKSTTVATMKQNNPAIATVVNFGVSFLHLNDTEKTEKPIEDTSPKIKPIKVFFSVFPKAIMIIPIDAIKMDTQTFNEIFSLRNK